MRIYYLKNQQLFYHLYKVEKLFELATNTHLLTESNC